jgi:DNA-binding NarL/FixJ family response regulator
MARRIFKAEDFLRCFFMENISKSRLPTEPTAARPLINVWLVEDNHLFRDTVARALNEVGDMRCSQVFSNAEDALDALLGGAIPDIIMLDIELPGKNGILAASQFKSITPATPIVMLTAFDDGDKIFEAICAGASGYLVKNSPPLERIVDAVHEALRGGAPMTPHVAKLVLDKFAKLSKPKIDYGLTMREKKVLELMVEGLISKEIASRLDLSYHTVDTHVRNIYTKLHVHTRIGAVTKVFQERIF